MKFNKKNDSTKGIIYPVFSPHRRSIWTPFSRKDVHKSPIQFLRAHCVFGRFVSAATFSVQEEILRSSRGSTYPRQNHIGYGPVLSCTFAGQ